MTVIAPPAPIIVQLVRGEVASFHGGDGRRLGYRVIRAVPERHTIVYLHGIESHGGWFLPAALRLAEHGTTTYLVDRRGSGLNRDRDPGDTPSATMLLNDLRCFRAHTGLVEPVLVGLSWGGKLAVAAALDQPVRALILVTPGLVPRVDLSSAQKALALLDLAVGGRGRFHLPITPEMFTRTARFVEYIRRDPNRLERVSARFLLSTRALDQEIRNNIHRLRVPVQLFLASEDRIVDNERTLALCNTLPEGLLHVKTYAGADHSIQFDRTAELVRDMRAFLDEVAW